MGRKKTRPPTQAELDRQRELATDPIRLAVVARVESLGVNPSELQRWTDGRVSHDTIRRYLQGTATPNGGNLAILLEVLGWDGKMRWGKAKTISQKSETPG